MGKLSFEEFKTYMGYIRDKFEMDEAVQEILGRYPRVLSDVTLPIDLGCEHIVSLLEKIMNIPSSPELGSTLSWWVYDLDFGKEFEVGDIKNNDLPKDHKYTTPDLSTLKNLYEYLVWEAERSGGENT